MKKIVFLLLMAAPFLYAQPQMAGDDQIPGSGQNCCGGGVIQQLKLTSDQEKQFDKLSTDMRKKQIEMRSKIQILRLDMKELFNETAPSKSKIEGKMKEIEKYQSEMRGNHLDFWFEVNKILTPEQQKTWKDHPLMMGGMKGKGCMMQGGMKHAGKHGGGMRMRDPLNCPNR